jgi:predicted Zn-dependent peptidase
MLPVDDTKVVKNTALWATYFGRFNRADIEILIAEEKSEEQQKLIKTNLKAIKELLSNLKLNIRLRHPGKSSSDLYTEAVNNSLKEQFNLLIIPGWQISKTDDLFGFPEVKIIKEAGELPVLCVNPNRDMYILCD